MKTIPLIKLDDPEEKVCWVELKQAQCLLHAPSSNWGYAQTYYMRRIADYETRLRKLNKQRVENHLRKSYA